MRIAGLGKTSLVDYPGKIAAVVFSPLCDFDCYFCHNRSLISDIPESQVIPEEKVFSYLRKRVGKLDGVVLTGGEPTLQPGLISFAARVKALGYAVKLDTNGAHPDVLRDAIASGQFDYIAMDVKAPRERYREVSGVDVDISAIQESIELLMRGDILYEFRTTVIPRLTQADIIVIAQWIQGARQYALQQYQRPEFSEEVIDLRLGERPYPAEDLEAMRQEASAYVGNCVLRGVVEGRPLLR